MSVTRIMRLIPAVGLLCAAMVCQAQNEASCKFSLYRLTSGQSDVTHPFGVNDFNNSVGELATEPTPGNFVFRGFIHFSNGTVRLFTAPHSSSTSLRDRNDAGVNIGNFFDTTTQKAEGFVLNGSSFVSVSHPNAPRGTNLTRINKFGSIVGAWFDSAGSPHGFKLINGTFQSIMFPGSIQTLPNGINDNGVIVGWYTKPNTTLFGFVFKNGVYTTLNFPHPGATDLRGISNAGVIVGVSGEIEQGQSFMRLPNGAFELINVPNAFATDVTGISAGGIITGRAFFNSDGTWHGFTGTCQ